MEIKYAVRTISPSPHNGPCYLQESDYGLQLRLGHLSLVRFITSVIRRRR